MILGGLHSGKKFFTLLPATNIILCVIKPTESKQLLWNCDGGALGEEGGNKSCNESTVIKNATKLHNFGPHA
jgi:hypothetical protein